MNYVLTKAFSLKNSPKHDEKSVQELLASNPLLLGLGEIEHIESERIQKSGGRLDLMFQSDDGQTRYCVELQLGATDPSHIIRTLEYWDNERAKNPHIEHIAVIVAEDITSRFLNVISLFNKSIPLIAIQLSAFEFDGKIGISCVKVLDLAENLGWEEEGSSAVSQKDRGYWEKKGSPETVKLADSALEIIKNAIHDKTLELKYNVHYIGLAHHGVADNFMSFKPRRTHLIVQFKIPYSEELKERLEESFALMSYNQYWGLWIVRMSQKDFKDNQPFFEELVRLARGVTVDDEEEN